MERMARGWGAFEQDETSVFRSTIDDPFYWRGEAKDVYDGREWHRGKGEWRVIEVEQPTDRGRGAVAGDGDRLSCSD